MSFSDDIRQLIKNRMVIRHRTEKELSGEANCCLICRREINLPAGTLCLGVGNEGLVCSTCGKRYATEMVIALGEQQPMSGGIDSSGMIQEQADTLEPTEWLEIAHDIENLTAVCAELAKGIARGIIEAPAGHIGLMHYAKDIKKPLRKETESEKDYELRVRTHRMARLYEKISVDTVGRIERIKKFLQKLGLPSISE
ncbi:MAG: hypothetical protein JW913_10500 [Chitinispirillaceae bacterium]|nr:hypothetical protein [Chitinispirillaceae bacterium]